MDMKSLMVKSIVDKKVLRCTKRLYFGTKCYIVKFEVRGKYMIVKNIKRGRQSQHPAGRQRLKLRHSEMIRYKRKIYNCNALQLAAKKDSGSIKTRWDCQSSSETLTNHTSILPRKLFTSPSNVSSSSHIEKEIVGDSCHWNDPYWSSHSIGMPPNRIVYTPSYTTVCRATQTSLNFKNTLSNLAITCGQTRSNCSTLQCCNTGTQTYAKGISLMHSAQQTIATLSCLFHYTCHNTSHKYQQTEIMMQTQSIQCRCKVFHIGVQTQVLHHVNSSTQIWCEDINETRALSPPLCYNNYNVHCSMRCKYQSCPSEDSLLPSPKTHTQVEKEAVIYMLSEIGELVLNQNHMLSNNTRLLDQLSEMSLLTKRMEIGRLWSKRRQLNIKRKHKQLSRLARRKRLTSKPFNSTSTAVQTDITHIVDVIRLHKATNTSIDYSKSRKLKFFEKAR